MTSAEQRFADLYESYFVHIHAYCRRRTSPERVDDDAAEAFLAAWRRIDEIPDGPDALPWLYRVAFGVVSNSRRRRNRQQRLTGKLRAVGIPHSPPVEDFVVRRQQAEEILEALSQLKSHDQEILRLAVWEDLSNSEIAVATGLSDDAVRQRLSRARKRLAARYDQLSQNTQSSPNARKGGSL